MKRLFVLLLVLTLSASINTSAEQTQPTSKREQRKLKKQGQILRALDILKSGKFKFIEPRPYNSRFGGYWLSDWRESFNISDPYYKAISTDIDTAKSMYTFVYSKLGSGGEEITTVEYNFKTGSLKVINRIDKVSAGGVIGNYSCIYALDEEPRK